jgi:hypothetical protein
VIHDPPSILDLMLRHLLPSLALLTLIGVLAAWGIVGCIELIARWRYKRLLLDNRRRNHVARIDHHYRTKRGGDP